MILNYKAKLSDSGNSIKSILKDKLNISNNLLSKLKKNNQIFLNKIPTKINCFIMPYDLITVNVKPEKKITNIKPEKIHLDIIYEDEFLIILNKEPNIVVHPTYLYSKGTIANGLLNYFIENNLDTTIRPVSRLDKKTSGLIVFAKNAYIQESLILQMKNMTFIKKYIGITEGVVKNDFGTINAPIGRKPESIIERCVLKSGSIAITHYKVLKRFKFASLLSFQLETGRTHQIRVHCKHINHPLIGDDLYNHKEKPFLNRQALHSSKIKFIHPISSKVLKLSAPIPYDIKNLLNKLSYF
ncbi:MAG: RluA family pseudouridine synthase [Clostridiales bacterium]